MSARRLGDTRYVTRRELRGGAINHLIRGTDIRVKTVVRLHLKGYAIEEIRDEFPTLSMREIQAALRFFREHRDEFK